MLGDFHHRLAVILTVCSRLEAAMLAQLEIEEDVAPEEQVLTAAERRERNALAIAEVVGRNPMHTPTDDDRSRSPRKDQV
jgi:hypothetical protein